MGHTKWKFSGMNGVNDNFSIRFTFQIKFDFLFYTGSTAFFVFFYSCFKVLITGRCIMKIWDGFMQGIGRVIGK